MHQTLCSKVLPGTASSLWHPWFLLPYSVFPKFKPFHKCLDHFRLSLFFISALSHLAVSQSVIRCLPSSQPSGELAKNHSTWIQNKWIRSLVARPGDLHFNKFTDWLQCTLRTRLLSHRIKSKLLLQHKRPLVIWIQPVLTSLSFNSSSVHWAPALNFQLLVPCPLFLGCKPTPCPHGNPNYLHNFSVPPLWLVTFLLSFVIMFIIFHGNQLFTHLSSL